MSSEKTSNLLLHFLPQCLSLRWGPEINFLCLEYLIAWIPGKYKIFIHVIRNWKFIFTVLWVALFIRENDFSKYLNSIELCHKTYLLTLLFWKANQIQWHHSFSLQSEFGCREELPKTLSFDILHSCIKNLQSYQQTYHCCYWYLHLR